MSDVRLFIVGVLSRFSVEVVCGGRLSVCRLLKILLMIVFRLICFWIVLFICVVMKFCMLGF